jgi:hypothetical protein
MSTSLVDTQRCFRDSGCNYHHSGDISSKGRNFLSLQAGSVSYSQNPVNVFRYRQVSVIPRFPLRKVSVYKVRAGLNSALPDLIGKEER